MPHDIYNDYYRITLDNQFGFEQLFTYCRDQFGFVYLQDDNSPVIAFFPKTYAVFFKDGLQKDDCQYPNYLIKTYTRQQDFSYKNQSTSTDNILNAFPKIKPCDHHVQEHGFTGGYISFISYDLAAEQNTICLTQHADDHHNHGNIKSKVIAILGEYDIFIQYIEQKWQLYYHQSLEQHPEVTGFIQTIAQSSASLNHEFSINTALTPRWSKQDYDQAFQKVQAYLKAGDCYQVNLTQVFETEIQSGRLLDLLPELLQFTHAPFSGYIHHHDPENGYFELLSCSPELFLSFHEQQRLKTRPIKGTMPRHQDEKIDQQLKNTLIQSEKDRAENLMIVDLLRNDLSVYAKIGSVNVPKLFELESFKHVHHLVSEIQAELLDDIDLFEVLFRALPGGSITGAPKIRAMQIIDELEAANRGAYCGTLGYINHNGTGRFNILIRSIQRYQQYLALWAGGGITIASEMEAEYDECYHKINAIMQQLNQYAKP
ncbi:anthranilate synthase component I family protein [Acinetobacter sp. c1-l78]|uniref:anthranilate synthase component I family protein n=1 Tax=Acinetobacter sp. c1-l78 TaxID=3342803 RepID=UPI0035B80B29